MSDLIETDMPQETAQKTGKPKKPGRLIAQAAILLHTRPAQRLFRGHFYKVTGVMAFSRQLMKIWQAAAEDDPFADWYLIKTYDAIFQARKQLAALQQNYQKLFTAQDSLRLAAGTSSKPVEFSLQFGTPYGYMAAYLIADYDLLARLFLSARTLGLADGFFAQVLDDATEQVRQALNKPMEWDYTGITRIDVEQNNQRAQQASDKLGKVPKQVLTGKLRAPYAPAVKKKTDDGKEGVKDE